MHLWNKICGFGLTASFLVAVGCGDDSGTSSVSDGEFSRENMCQGTDFGAASFNVLPACVESNNGQTGCVLESNEIYVCADGTWNLLMGESSGSETADGENNFSSSSVNYSSSIEIGIRSSSSIALFSSSSEKHSELSSSSVGNNKSSSSISVMSSSVSGRSSSSVAATYYASFPTRQELAVKTMYDNWINKFYVTFEQESFEPVYLGPVMSAKLQGSARIKFDTPANTVSEGIGYGLLITCMMEDWEKFDRLLKYYKAYPVDAASGLYFMKWMVKGDPLDGATGNGGFVSSATGGSATDADLDVVTALLVAYQKTSNEEYKDFALLVGNAILKTEVNSTTHLLMPGNDGKHMNDGFVYNISYFSLVALKLLAEHDAANAAAWNQILDASIEYMTKVQAAGNGLWPDWSNAEGVPTDPENGSSTGKNNNFFGLEGVRIPLRIMWYYNWFNDSRAQAMASTAAQFTFTQTGGDITKTLIRYIYQGEQPVVGAGGAHFRGSVCTLWTVDKSYATSVEACNQVILSTAFSATRSLYFEPSMQMLYALYLNGFFTKN